MGFITEKTRGRGGGFRLCVIDQLQAGSPPTFTWLVPQLGPYLEPNPLVPVCGAGDRRCGLTQTLGGIASEATSQVFLYQLPKKNTCKGRRLPWPEYSPDLLLLVQTSWALPGSPGQGACGSMSHCSNWENQLWCNDFSP